jgi:hypothetical protein
VTIERGSGLSAIGKSAFADCLSLLEVSIPSSVTSLHANCFRQCVKLAVVAFEVNSTVSRIGEYAFARCSSLSWVFIPASVTVIRPNCFRECGSLRRVTFDSGSKLLRIARSAFSKCAQLSLIKIPSRLQSILTGYGITQHVRIDDDSEIDAVVDGGCVSVARDGI